MKLIPGCVLTINGELSSIKFGQPKFELESRRTPTGRIDRIEDGELAAHAEPEKGNNT